MKRRDFIILFYFMLISSVIPLLIQSSYVTNINYSNNNKDLEDPRTSKVIAGTKEWLNNTGFNSTEDWYYSRVSDESNPDFYANISSDTANFIVTGDKKVFSDINGTPSYSDWFPEKKPGSSIFPDRYEINQYGLNASHEYWEGTDDNIYGVRGNQTRNRPTVLWKRVIEMPVDMSDYIITSANLTFVLNGSANTNVETPKDNLTGNNPTAAEYDHVKYYVQLSNLEDKDRYDAISYQPRDLGFGDLDASLDSPNNGSISNITDTTISAESEEVLVFYLNRILEYDNRNFTIFLGIDIDVEDNYGQADRDTYYSLLIKTCNLTFTYEKIIDKYTSVSWNQDGDKISDLSNDTIVINDANLNFKYKIDSNWTSNTSSLNSEIKILINGNPHAETIKLTKANSTYQEAKIGGFDVTSLITDDVNISLQVYIADEFILDHNITISIDNASLMISYTIITQDVLVGGNGGGGGTTIIRGADYTLLVIGLTAGIIALVTFFGAYQIHYKYPPIVRKVRKLRKKIKKGRKAKPLIIEKRKNLIKNQYEKNVKILEFEAINEAIKSQKIDKIKKIKKKNKKGDI